MAPKNLSKHVYKASDSFDKHYYQSQRKKGLEKYVLLVAYDHHLLDEIHHMSSCRFLHGYVLGESSSVAIMLLKISPSRK